LSRPAGKAKKSIAPGLKRVRKEIPPPSKAFDSKKRYSRKRAGQEARRALDCWSIAPAPFVVISRRS
jgi:hypothetical protein